ncbi:MAG: hypothetical protein ACE5JP_01220 [Candidatus Bipolaricaulia bacterium]
MLNRDAKDRPKTTEALLMAVLFSIQLALSATLAMPLPVLAKTVELGGVESYFPLVGGSFWEYDSNVGTMIFEIGSAVTQGGRQLHVVESSVNGTLVQREYYFIEAHRIYAYAREYPSGLLLLDPPEPMFDFPLAVGKVWNWIGRIGSFFEADIDFKVLREEVIEVPAGRFKTMRIRISGEASDGSNTTTTRWFAEGVGMVKEVSEVVSRTGESFAVQAELATYRIGPAR